jgi:hypothetical protein
MANILSDFIRKIFGPITDKDNAASMIADYTKRYLEGKYTKLMDTPTGKKLIELGGGEKNVLEFVAYLVSAMGGKKLPENTIAQKAFKQVVVDFAPEIMKRIRNGDLEVAKAIKPGNEKKLIETIFELDGEKITSLISLLNGLEEPLRSQILENLSGLSSDKLGKLAVFDGKIMAQVSQFFESDYFNKDARTPKKESLLSKIESELKGLNQFLEERIEKKET